MQTQTISAARSAGLVVLVVSAMSACATTGQPSSPSGASGQPKFGDVLKVLQEHTDVVVLHDESGEAEVAVVPKYQGRVMTSTASGVDGVSLGWVNLDLIRSGKTKPQFNPFGGAERIWLGPEGSQFSIYFDKGVNADFEHWRVPAAIDTEAWPVTERTATQVAFAKDIHVENQSGTVFDVRVSRTVRLLDRNAIREALHAEIPDGVSVVAYESENVLTNAGKEPWRKETGLLSLWMLGMFPPGAKTNVVVPFETGPEAERGPIVHDEYFGKVPADRLRVGNGVLFFKGDGRQRGKIGVPRRRVKPILGSYDPSLGVLTLIQFTLPDEATEYVNSKWGPQDEPFSGDVANAYNDGPTPAGPPLGPFYELESSSPAAALAPGDSQTHVHRTIHLRGQAAGLDALCQKWLGVSLHEIETALP